MTTDSATPRVALADYLQAAEIETHILVQEEDSVRADWWRASCGLHDWYTTGSRPVVEDAAAHHVAWDHTACAAVDPDSPAEAPLYCRALPDHDGDHWNGGREWASDREPAAMTSATARNASHYFATDRAREGFLTLFGDKLDSWFTPEFVHYLQHGTYPAAGPAVQPALTESEPLRDEYGIRATYISTLTAEGAVADNLYDALIALDRFDEKRGSDVVSRELVQRKVSEWRKVGGAE